MAGALASAGVLLGACCWVSSAANVSQSVSSLAATSSRKLHVSQSSLEAAPNEGQNIWEKRAELLADPYDADIPPPNMVKGVPLQVKIGVNIRHLHFDIITGMLRVQAWYRLMWQDDRFDYLGEEAFGMQFNPVSSYLPIDVVQNSVGQVWVPDVYVTEANDFQEGFAETPLQVRPSDQTHCESTAKTNVKWSRPGEFNVFCNERTLKDFPFEIEKCVMTFESWAFDASWMVVTPAAMAEGFDVGYKKVNGNEYTLLNDEQNKPTLETTITHYASTNSTYSSVILTVSLARLPTYYVLNAILPMLMMLVLSQLTFWIPINPDYSGSGERLAYASTALLTVVAILIFTTDKRPMIREDTWLDKFQARCVALVFVPMVETAIVFALEQAYSDIGTHKDVSKIPPEEIPQGLDSKWEIIDAAQGTEVAHSQASLCIWEWVYQSTHGWVTVCPRNIDLFCQQVYPIITTVSMLHMWLKVPKFHEVQHMEDNFIWRNGYGIIFMVALFLVVLSTGMLIVSICKLFRGGERPVVVNWRYSRSRRVQAMGAAKRRPTAGDAFGMFPGGPGGYNHPGPQW